MSAINRDKAIEVIEDELDKIDHVPQWIFDRLTNRLRELPPEEPQRIKGRWIPSSNQCGIKCSECGLPPDDFCYSIDYIELDYAPNFCPNCGSDNRKR